jgi:hypothetical protein
MSVKATFALLATFLLIALSGHAQGTFNSGSNGSDGALDLTGQQSGTTVWLYPWNYPGNQHALGIFNWTTVTIPSGVTLKLSGFITNMPLYFLASGNVDIEGTVDLSGAAGANASTSVGSRVPPAPGPGGYTGGLGGLYGSNTFLAEPGSGPGGSAGAPWGTSAANATYSGNQFCNPLVGGSGGGAATGNQGFPSTQYGAGGGSGGGAILISSSTQITVNGTINANGGSAGYTNAYWGGCGSGGAVRLVSTAITGSGTVTAVGQVNCSGAALGMVRLEAYTNSFQGTVTGTEALSAPYQLLLPTASQPAIQVTSINGVAINANPFQFPDIEINTSSPVPLVISATQVPTGTIPTITIFTETGDQVVSCPGGLQGALASSSCTVNVTFPGGGTRGLVKAVWQ